MTPRPTQRVPRLRDLDRAAHLRDPARKQRYVTALFDTVAPSYDRFTPVFSFGMDARWKATLLRLVEERLGDGATVVDLATGTGDLARGMARAQPGARVVGVDVSLGMLTAGARRGTAAAARAAGDMMALPLADGVADAATAAYAFRNVPDRRTALREAHRVLRPGGVLATLDFYRPAGAVGRALFVSYLRMAGALAGWWWHRLPQAYSYLGPSVAGWVTAGEFSDDLEAAGFEIEAVLTRLCGGIALHAARRSGRP